MQPQQGAQAGQAAQEAARAEAARGAEQAMARAFELARSVQEQQQGRLIIPGGLGSPTAIYEAARQQRRELINQLDRLESQRENLSDELRSPQVSGADQKGIEARIAGIDSRIAEVESQIAKADADVARAAAIPGAVQEPRPPVRSGPPEEVYFLTGMFLVIVLLPLTIAYARRIWRRGAAAVAAIPQEIYDRFNRLDQAVDSVAIEVERIGEGQRFLTRMAAERGLGAGPAERIETPERDPVRQGRK